MKNKSLILLTALTFLVISISIAYADTDVSVGVQTSEDVNLNVGINAGGNVDVTIDGTNIGSEINELNQGMGNLNQQVGTLNGNINSVNDSVGSVNDTVNMIYTDVYGSSPHSPDGFLEGAENATENPMSDYCNDPALTAYFNTFSSIPPAGFKEQMKLLGYDDEAHINLIWTVCQEKRLNSIDSSINQNSGSWGTDTGINFSDVVTLIERAVNLLLGTNKAPTESETRVAKSLDSYFASDADIEYLLLRTQDLHFRVRALENAMNNISSEAYCKGKLDVLYEYGLESVDCGNTTYHNHMKNPITGQPMVVGITPYEWAE